MVIMAIITDDPSLPLCSEKPESRSPGPCGAFQSSWDSDQDGDEQLVMSPQPSRLSSVHAQLPAQVRFRERASPQPRHKAGKLSWCSPPCKYN